MRRFAIFLALLGVILSFPSVGQASLLYEFSVRNAAGDTTGAPLNLALDFWLRYEASKSSSYTGGIHYNLSATAEGSQAFAEQIREWDHMVGTVAFTGYKYGSGKLLLSAPEQDRFIVLHEKGVDNRTDDEDTELDALNKKALGKRTLISGDLHYRFETTAQIEEKQHAFGLGLGSDIPMIAEALDLLPRTFRGKADIYEPPPVRVYLGADYVAPQDSLALVEGWRLRGEVAWSTRLVQRISFLTLWTSDYRIPDAAEGARFSSFFTASIIVPTVERVGVEVSYKRGSRPPLYEEVRGGFIGVTLYSF